MDLDFSKTFRKGQKRKGLTQETLATVVHVAKSTMNGYFKGHNTPLETAIDITNKLDDFETSMDFSSQILGLLKLFDGPRFKHDVLSLDAFTAKEDSEAVEAYTRDHVRWLLADDAMDKKKLVALKNFGEEDLDSILMHLGRLDKICQRTGITPMQMFHERMPYYVKQGYMDTDNLDDGQRHEFYQERRQHNNGI